MSKKAKKTARAKGRSVKDRSAVTGRYVVKGHGQRNPKTTTRERSKASQFADNFIERHPDTFHELSKR